MYHFSNQPLYQHNEYHQCSMYDHSKNQISINNLSIPTHNNQFDALIPQNVTAAPGNLSKQPEVEPQVLKSEKNKKKAVNKTVVDTSCFSIEERLIAAAWVHERKRTKSSMSQIKHDFRQRFGREPPAKNTLLVWERKLFSTGSVCDAPRTGRPLKRGSRVEEVAASVRSAPTLSMRARARALRLPRTTLRTILHQDLAHTKIKDAKAGKTTGVAHSKRRTTKQSTKLHTAPAPAPAAAHPPLYAPPHPQMHHY